MTHLYPVIVIILVAICSLVNTFVFSRNLLKMLGRYEMIFQIYISSSIHLISFDIYFQNLI